MAEINYGCPFCDASIHFGQIIRMSRVQADLAGNRCALITEAHSPCWMTAFEKRDPDWRRCPRNPEFESDRMDSAAEYDRGCRHAAYMDSLCSVRSMVLQGTPDGVPPQAEEEKA